MKNREKKQEEQKQSALNAETEQINDNSAQLEDLVCENKKSDFEISREDMSDEEYIECLEERLGKCMAESEMCRNLTQRLQADFDNYRKRNANLGDEMKHLGISLVIEKLLTVLDNCDLARKYIQDESALTGFNMMETQILSALEAFGLETIEAEGKDFDAKFMSAVEREQSEGNEGKVIGVLAKGYILNGKVLRPSGVKVGC